MAVRSLDQRLVCETLAGRHQRSFRSASACGSSRCLHSAGRRIRQRSDQVLRAGVVIYADDAALENREDTLDSIGRHVVSNILASGVIDSGVLKAGVATPT